jgi:hypothetical protein
MGIEFQRALRRQSLHMLLISIAMMFNVDAMGQVTVWESEAENGIRNGTVDIKDGCTYASGGLFVRMYNDEGNELRFNDVEALRTGDHLLVIHYFYVGASALELLVNGISAGTLEFSSATWCYQGPSAFFSINIRLNEGSNELAFRTVGGQVGPFLDRFMVLDEEVVRDPGSYYVCSSEGSDSNSGTGPDKPWKTLEKVNSSIFVPGDTILFRAGSEFSGQLRVNSSGTAAAPILFTSYGQGDQPVINGATAPGGAYQAAVFINNQSFIEMSGLEITNDRRISRSGVNDKEAYGIYLLNDGDSVMEHFQFRDLVIREVYAINTEGVDFNALQVAGIYFRSERNTVIGKEKHIRDVLVDSCYITRTGKFGIWSQHRGGDAGVGNDSLNRNMNLVFRNNHFFETGGSGITPGSAYNCLLEHNTFEYTGSDADPRMAQRGSGAWFWNCRNVVAQFNRSLHVRGPADSYGMHIDFGNRNVILQYNYSEDSEGGFVEILGKNVNSVYRFNVSVNDGIRSNKGNSIWVSTYAGENNRVPSDSNYIYNNTIYAGNGLTPDIYIEGKNTFIYNNIFYTAADAVMGETTDVIISPGSVLEMSNNLFFGNVNGAFSSLDDAPVFGDPLLFDPGSQSPEGYTLLPESPALSVGKTFEEPAFPMAGKGIFKDVSIYPEQDLFGNAVDVRAVAPHIGAFNGDPDGTSILPSVSFSAVEIKLFPNPVRETLTTMIVSAAEAEAGIHITDMTGRSVLKINRFIVPGENLLRIAIPNSLKNGFYLLNIQMGETSLTWRFVLVR